VSDPRFRSHRRFRRRTTRILVDFLTDAGPRREIATTLGAGGLFVQTEALCRKGTVLKLRFQISDQSKTHEIEGRVVWCNRPAPDAVGAPGMGIEFTDRNATRDLADELDSLV
jgi:uncharacterized protein (TIGR02266 family)